MRLGALVPAALVLTAAVFATAGCGTGNISPESVADAAQATIDAGGSRIAFNATSTAEGKRIPMTGTGVQDSKGKRGRLVLDVSRAFAGRKLPKGVDRA